LPAGHRTTSHPGKAISARALNVLVEGDPVRTSSQQMATLRVPAVISIFHDLL